jgi:hypothetical protein
MVVVDQSPRACPGESEEHFALAFGEVDAFACRSSGVTVVASRQVGELAEE